MSRADAPLAVDRRTLLRAALGSFTLAVAPTGRVWAQDGEKKYGAASMPHGTVDDPLVFVSITPDGMVTIVAHRAEMGTGVRTSLPMVVADEMEAVWDRVRVVQADADEARYGNQNVDGSRSVRHFLVPMRRVGAAARQMLESAAAAQWAVPLSQVRAGQHRVVHISTGRSLGYGELAAAAAKLPVPQGDAVKLKTPSQFRYIGKGQVRGVDQLDIGRGKAVYGMDVRQPGMVYAVVARPPVLGGKLREARREKALAVPGVLKLVDIPALSGAPAFQPLGGIAVVGRTTWAAIQGRAALEATWDDGPHAAYDSGEYRKQLEALVRVPGKTVRNEGDAPAALLAAPAARKLAAEYYLPHLAHASMEPPVATVVVHPDRCEAWASIQNPAAGVEGVAAATGMKPEQVKLHVTLLGGGFGRKSKPDFVVEAARVAKEMPGTPVKLVWTRDDDIRHDYFHTVSVERLEAVTDARGRPQAWLHRSAAPSITTLFGGKGPSPFEMGMSAVNMPFAIPNFRVEGAEVDAHTRIGWFRSVSNIPHAFAVQSFIDELAHQAGADPRRFALDLIGPRRQIRPTAMADNWNYQESPDIYTLDTGRMRDVLEAATRGARWGRQLPEGSGLGLAFAYSFLSYTAAVIEASVDKQGAVTVHAVDIAIDCGPQINPERIRAQLEGGVVMGLGLALSGEITFVKGQAQQSNFHDYEVLRHNASPRVIRTHLVNDNHATPPGGVGEPPVPPIAPALCNAIFAATGKRIRALPIRTVA